MRTGNNPYSDAGKIVYGARFLGRDRSLQQIEGRVTAADSPGNLAIIGEPRIGKSSLAWQGIMSRRDELLQSKAIAIWIDVGLFDAGWDLFVRLVIRARDALEEQGWLTPSVDKKARTIIEVGDLNEQSQADILSFFTGVSSCGAKILFVLDEFDHARMLWAGDKSGFELLREISYNADCSVTLITTSRRTIAEIQKQSGVISTLSGTFFQEFLKPFDETEITEFFSRLATLGVKLKKEEKQLIQDYTGGHPFFLDTIAFNLAEDHLNGRSIDVASAYDRVTTIFYDEYHRLKELMSEDGTINKLIQVLFGPVFDVEQSDITKFLKYGIIKDDESRYVAFSNHFQEYLQSVSRGIDIWPMWRETEQSLRRIIEIYLQQTYGEDWENAFRKARPKWVTMIDGWVASRESEKKKYGTHASDSLVDYTYPGELFTIVNSDWRWFGKIFPNQPSHWKRPFEVLAAVRTPLAHNRSVSDGTLKEVTGLCQQVLQYLDQWEQKRDDDGAVSA
jgi:hypothetical protein